jgi:flagellar motor switch/type III secretory pathway protein FliN
MAVASYRASRPVADEEGEEMSSERDEENAAPVPETIAPETVDAPQQEEFQRNLPLHLQLVVRVELETRNLTIEEVAELHPGQILALGCRASDPVRLVTDAGRIARGELVEIEGRLGVVLSQLDR